MAVNIPGVISMAFFYLLVLGTGIWASFKSRREQKPAYQLGSWDIHNDRWLGVRQANERKKLCDYVDPSTLKHGKTEPDFYVFHLHMNVGKQPSNLPITLEHLPLFYISTIGIRKEMQGDPLLWWWAHYITDQPKNSVIMFCFLLVLMGLHHNLPHFSQLLLFFSISNGWSLLWASCCGTGVMTALGIPIVGLPVVLHFPGCTSRMVFMSSTPPS
ncbi:high affinity choline transporter 1-like protein [Lates japonicus]|uniref:High affinity choline transporter 1-like protein n=1 Tax=Lates japonicus TaxID=270547 RepID=A0AAD3RIL7_LATJO|nr:high affinity choline transporter 1-like protein [Lates japonicus]